MWRRKAPLMGGPSQEPLASRQGHLNALDGLRGTAAFAVTIAHCLGVYADSRPIEGVARTGVHLLMSFGHPSVVLFYVLSGFVLHVAHARAGGTSYAAFLLKRFFRIYPALAVALLAALALHALAPTSPAADLGAWTNFNSVYPTGLVMALRNLLLVGVTEADRLLDPVSWSLSIEVRFSILFPLLAGLLGRTPLGFVLLSASAYAVSLFMLASLGMHPPYQIGATWLGAVAVTLFYLPGFCAGMLAAHVHLSRPMSEVKLPLPVEIVAIGAMLIIAKVGDSDLVTALVATALIVIATFDGLMRRLLSGPIARFLGQVSYSLYLVHFPILMASVHLLHTRIGLAGSLAVVPVASLVISAAMYRWIELPGIRLGKRLSRRIGRSLREPARERTAF